LEEDYEKDENYEINENPNLFRLFRYFRRFRNLSGIDYANTISRPALWSANHIEETGRRIDCYARHRAGDQCYHDYLQHCGRDNLSAFFFS
jgi:hypothetical protein